MPEASTEEGEEEERMKKESKRTEFRTCKKCGEMFTGPTCPLCGETDARSC